MRYPRASAAAMNELVLPKAYSGRSKPDETIRQYLETIRFFRTFGENGEDVAPPPRLID